MSVPLTLAIDAAISIGTVAVFRGGELAAEDEVPMRGQREERLMPAVQRSLERAGGSAAELERVVCGAGPGSFTSLRIAAAIAKGLVAARGCALHSVSSLALLAAGARPSLSAGRYLAALDAMRGECFAAPLAVDGRGLVTLLGAARLLPRADVDEEARRLGAVTLGAGMAVEARPHARGALQVTELPPAELDSWEPEYGRLAEAQVRWEAAHGRPLPAR